MGGDPESAFARASRAVSIASLLTATLVPVSGCKRDSKDQSAGSKTVRVAAASDLSLAFEELGRVFSAQTGQEISFSFGSTGLLAKQLRQGAPFDLFAAASASFVDDVVRAGSCDANTKAPYARGRIAVWSRRDGRVRPVTRLEELAEHRFTRIAIANPEHAPYGKAAKEALIAAGIWDAVQPRIVYGENVRQTLQLAQTGNVEAAIVALSLVIQDKSGAWTSIDESQHRPIEQALVVCKHGANAGGAQSFAAYVNSPPGRAIMRRYGFLLPGEELGPVPVPIPVPERNAQP